MKTKDHTQINKEATPMLTLRHTKVQTYFIHGRTVLVKREEQCAPKGAPTFSKVRGLIPHLKALQNTGTEVVGYVETSISMAGWGVAWACTHLGMKAVIFDPQYKETPAMLTYHRKQWAKYPVRLIPLRAGMARVNWNIARRILQEQYGTQAVLLHLGLPLPETIEATAEEITLTQQQHSFNSIVINVGSGTIAAGVWKGLDQGRGNIYGVMGRSGSLERKMKVITKKAGKTNDGFFRSDWQFILIDPGWKYTDKSVYPCPFPCHPYYDLKAWQWLCENIETLAEPILFWNIGAIK